tara:strand:+ start:80 stop:295 length:216 start_codon:yes stop_codon:yes gene_type:complete
LNISTSDEFSIPKDFFIVKRSQRKKIFVFNSSAIVIGIVGSFLFNFNVIQFFFSFKKLLPDSNFVQNSKFF